MLPLRQSAFSAAASASTAALCVQPGRTAASLSAAMATFVASARPFAAARFRTHAAAYLQRRKLFSAALAPRVDRNVSPTSYAVGRGAPAVACRTGVAHRGASRAASSSAPSSPPPAPKSMSRPMTDMRFWQSRSAWKRAGVNTLRCLVGCSVGNLSMMWYLQHSYTALGVSVTMGASVVAGLSTSLALETLLLRLGPDKLAWRIAARTAWGMSFASMVAMELAENAANYALTHGVVAVHDWRFWLAGAVSMAAGFLAPLPYNYARLRKYSKACH